MHDMTLQAVEIKLNIKLFATLFYRVESVWEVKVELNAVRERLNGLEDGV